MIIQFIEPQEAGNHLTKPIHTSMLYCRLFVGCRGYVLTHKPIKELDYYHRGSWLISPNVAKAFFHPLDLVIFPRQKDIITLKSRRVEC